MNKIKLIPIIIYCVSTSFCLAQIPSIGLIAHYPFCGNANDYSGNVLNGTVNGATLANDRFGNANNAYYFNGINDYISIPSSSFVGLDVYSYSMWIRPTSSVVSLAYSVGSNDPYCQSLSFNSTSVSAGSYNNGVTPLQSYVFSNTFSVINNWTHVVVTRDSSSIMMYVNGVLMTQLPSALTNSQSASYGSTPPYRAVIGTRSTLANYFFNGEIDDVRIYSTILTQNDVTALYNESSGSISVNSGSICAGSSFSLSPSGASSYTFSSNSAIVSPISTTIYTISGMNNNCVSSAMSTVVVNPLPNISISGPSPICQGSSTSFTANGAISYTWNTSTNNSILLVSPSVTTNYVVSGANSYGCINNASVSLIVEKCTSVTTTENEREIILIYPNPSTGNFYIRFQSDLDLSAEISIIDASGKLVNEVKLNNSSSSFYIEQSGIYFLKYTKKDQPSFWRKLIVVK